MKIYKETGKFIIAFCPQHQEENASFIINKCFHNGKPKGYAYCFSCGHRADYSPEFVDSMSNKKIQRFREQTPVDWHKLTTDFMLTKLDKDFYYLEKLAKEWNINIDALLIYFVGLYTNWGDHSKAYTIPMRNELGDFIGIQLRYQDGSKCCIEGSKLGLFLPEIFLPNKGIIICEGFSDAAVATDCGFFGLGRPSAQIGDSTVLDFLQLNNITDTTIVADIDHNMIGQKSAEKLGDLLEQNDIGCRIIMGSLEDCKDLRQFYMKYGRDKTIQILKG